MKGKRWSVAVMLLLATTINYLDRQAISVAGPDIAHDFGLGPGAMGIVFSCFFWSYTVLVLPMGYLLTKVSARFMMGAGMFVWALGSLCTGLAGGLGSLVGSRLLLGIGESPSYPAGNQIVREWAPRRERGLMVALFNGGSTAGPAVGIVATGLLLSVTGWRTAFVAIAAFTLVWAVVWALFYRSPETARWLPEPERRYVLEQREPENEEATERMPLRALVRLPAMWGLILTQGCQVYCMYLFLTWLPSYLRTVRHLNLAQSGWLGMAPYVVTTVGVLCVGALSDRLLRGADLSTGARRKFMALLMVLASCVLFVPLTDSVPVMEVLIIGAVLFSTAANTLNFALAGDLVHDRRSAGLVFGLVVLGGNTFGLAAPIVTGYVVAATQSYALSFALAAALLLIGTVITLTMVRRPLQPRTLPTPAPQTTH